MATGLVQETIVMKPRVARALKQAAAREKLTEGRFLERLLNAYLMDQEDIRLAQEALAEPERVAYEDVRKQLGF